VASDVNSVHCTARLTNDPQPRQGGKVCTFGIAINRSIRQEDGSWTDAVDFADVSCFNGIAQLVLRKAKKGDRVTISGRLAMSSWEVDGQRRTKLGIVANQIVGEYAFRSTEETAPPNTESFNAELDATVAKQEEAVA
jgi:single-strand DNA-binding protein